MVMQTPDEVPEERQYLFFDDRVAPLEDAIVIAALEYEQAWMRFAHGTRVEIPDAETMVKVMIDKAQAHQALLDAIRAYRDLLIEENN